MADSLAQKHRKVFEVKSSNQILIDEEQRQLRASEADNKARIARHHNNVATSASAALSTASVNKSGISSRSASERAHSPYPVVESPALSVDYDEEAYTVDQEYAMTDDDDDDDDVDDDEDDDDDEDVDEEDDEMEDDANGEEEEDAANSFHPYDNYGHENEQTPEEQLSSDDLSSDPPQQRSDGEWERIEEEIRAMEDGLEGLSNYEIVDKLGEGTFSSVYKAIDKNHFLYDNYLWTGKLPGPPPHFAAQGSTSRPAPPKNVYVALKRIYVTSSPQRILNELEIMEDLRDCQHIAFLISAFRSEDQIIAVMPYSRHTDFREYYRIMPLNDLKCYFRCLFSALEGAHAANIIHRDVKPANFLYDPRTGEGTLCDFGLAERFEPHEWRGKCHHLCPTNEHPFGRVQVNKSVQSSHLEFGGALHESSKAMSASGSTSARTKAMMGPPERIGVIREDTRQSVRANRAGTRGFRAPEVLYKCQDQTCALDIWSVGIIMMAFLTKRFPLFNSNDDTEALMELTIIFGRRRMAQMAILHNRTFHTNLPAEQTDGYRIPDFIVRLNPDILTPPSDHPNPQEYGREIQRAMDLCRACLQGDLTKRCTATEALKHPFLAETHSSASPFSSSPSNASSTAGGARAQDTWAV